LGSSEILGLKNKQTAESATEPDRNLAYLLVLPAAELGFFRLVIQKSSR